MTRRIAAGILALMLLMNLALPVGAADTTDDTVYPIGYKDMWVMGLETVPTAKTEYPGEWRPVYKEDGITRVSQPGSCPLHACDSGCFDVAGNKICGVAAGDEHAHNIKCTIEAIVKYATYQWQVVDPTGGGGTDETQPQETQPDDDWEDEEFDDGSASFYIHNIGEDNLPLTGSEFLLLEPRDNDPENSVIRAYAKTEEKNGKVLAYMKGIRLTGETDRVTWNLVQNALEGELSDKYMTNTTQWEVTIVRDAEGKHTIESIQPAGYTPETDSDGQPQKYPLYDEESRTLTIENELLRGTLVFDVHFEGLGETIPAEATATVTVGIPGGLTEELTFPNSQARYYVQQSGMYGLNLGTYTVRASAPAQIDGYTAEGPFIKVHQPVESVGMDGDSVVLDKNHLSAKFTITYRYTVECVHEYTSVVVAPTCTQNGYTLFTCHCGANYTEEGDPATGHNYQSVVTEPSCTTVGYTTYTCSNADCGHNYREDGAPATGHNYDMKDVPPTCEEKGYTEFTCINENCGESYKEYGADAIGHAYAAGAAVPATCTKNGYTPYTCSNCGDVETRNEVAAIGHKYDEKIVAPTCTEKGYTEHTCTNDGCNHSYRDTEVDAIGHKYDEKIVLPTCTEKGYTEHTCTNDGCNHSYRDTEVDAIGHKYNDRVVDPTDTEKGYTEHTCSNEGCGESYRDNYVDALQQPTETSPTEATESTEPNKDTATVKQSNIIVVRVLDDLGNPLEKSEISLYKDKELVRTWKATYDNIFVLDDLEQLPVEGESVTYTLRQTKAAAGHYLSTETYTVTISGQGTNKRVDIKKNTSSLSNLFKGSGVELGTDGKQIATFVNERKTTQLELNCTTVVDFGKGTWQDDELKEELSEKPYQFILTWENAKGEQQEEIITVEDEETVVPEAEIPYGTKYALTAADDGGTGVVVISENCEGTVSVDQTKENIKIDVVRTYTVESGETPALHLTKVDAQTKRPLQSVDFSLENDAGAELAAYTSDGNGEFIIKGILTKPGSYSLKETKTVEGYQLLAAPIRIEVTQQYEVDNTSGKPVYVQTMTTQIISNAVVEESDGSFWIENELIPAETVEEESGGLGAGAIIGICVAGAALLGALGFVMYRKKRKK